MPRCTWPDGCTRAATHYLFSVARGLEALCDEHDAWRVREWAVDG
jgi:hypothetical protein